MFEEQYNKWLEDQRKSRNGEPLRRLVEGHRLNEKAFAEFGWYPVVQNFAHLHAEYEVTNAWGRPFYVDFAYTAGNRKIAWEVDDFSTHGNANRTGFIYERERQNQLVLQGWTVIRIPLDTLRDHPMKVQQLILQALGKWYGTNRSTPAPLSLHQRETLRVAQRLQRPVTPSDVSRDLGVCSRTARNLLHQLTELNLLKPGSGRQRIRNYSPSISGATYWLE